MKRFLIIGLVSALCVAAAGGEVVKLKSTADIWLSEVGEEKDTSAGKAAQFKLKTIQETAAIRFDAAPARGRKVLSAKLLLHPAGAHKMRDIRVSTVAADWAEGKGTKNYGPASGATYNYADADTKRPWAWPGSQFADVTMTNGHTRATWAYLANEPGGWISVKLTAELIAALVAGDTDGLCVMDGGNLAYQNNFIHSAQSKFPPAIEVELGGPLTAVPAAPTVTAAPAPRQAHLNVGAVQVTIALDKDAFCWRLKLDGKPVQRWRVPCPAKAGPTVFCLEDLAPSKDFQLEVVAVSAGGAASKPTRIKARSSPALPMKLKLGAFRKPTGGAEPPAGEKMRVYVYPGLVKLSPQKGTLLFGDMGTDGDPFKANAVWNGRSIVLHGARGEYVSYQLCVQRASFKEPLKGVKVLPRPLAGPGGKAVALSEIELYRNWPAKNKTGKWQPAYCIPLRHGEAMDIPDPARKLRYHGNQSVYVDVYIPKDAAPGAYRGTVEVQADGAKAVALPVELTVYDFALPDRLSFWPELNAYHIPRDTHDYYRLAHQHRCVLNCWVIRPKLTGAGKGRKVVWDSYDKIAGPLLSGEAFRTNRRTGVPVRVMYLPFDDSWPTPLSTKNYNYPAPWPGRGWDLHHLVKHSLTAPYIGEALSQDYKDAFVAVERQFIEHFKANRWNRTEMQCFFGGKKTHRTKWGSNMWWTTDEPYHWEDWLALEFFGRLFATGRAAAGAKPDQWAVRADISRIRWQGRTLQGSYDNAYYGAGSFTSSADKRRSRILHAQTGQEIRTYGFGNRDTDSNTCGVAKVLDTWLNGSNALLPWQTLGKDGCLDNGDKDAGGGAGLLVPGKRFGLPVVGDMRLKTLRDAQQIVEYLVELSKRRGLNREQIKYMVLAAMEIKTGMGPQSRRDDADAPVAGMIPAWQLSELRRTVAELIAKTPK